MAIEDAASGGEVQERFRGTELLPCPFCGGGADLLEFGFNSFVRCTECKATSDDCGKERTVAKWNARTALKARGD